MKWILSAATFLLAAACGSDPVSVTHAETSDGIVRFDVRNRTDRDIRSMTFELSYHAQGGDVVRVDTMAFETTTGGATGDTIPFVRAEDETFIVSSLPESAIRAVARVLELTFWDGTAWP